ncbi:MAG: disulfide oxidoreductase [Rhodospirillales bacterium]|nr:disulfide oxidoreductase [Rhodospirillales bacterium]
MTAVLGPTNTGKTHLAVERMLGHQTGMIGLPLRLLAREIHDRIVARRGSRQVALITGEERIVPRGARYFICTTESMPLDLPVEFLAIDEIQLCADPGRGHTFTDRLLRARGLSETMVMGAATMRPVIRELVPDAEFIVRPRFSKLSYAGFRKITRLPPRSAVVAFSVAEVYELAETLRRQRGGCAVVLGALSPRVRNAQVAMYQEGEVDHMVATDAIGMGLNMDVRHVAFAATRKFDGARPRDLKAAELAQIAGRAGRHMNDGTFGTTWTVERLDDAVTRAIESHTFNDVKAVMWRNAKLDFRSPGFLLKSLEKRSDHPMLMRDRMAADHMALADLARDPEIAALASNPEAVRLLWEICQVPDFRKVMHDHHVRLLAHICRHLMGATRRLPQDWVMRSIERLDRSDGDIDMLMTRIAHIRTWTYISHRSDWVEDHDGLQEAARAIEDRLSDTLHERLTQRFVDRRAATVVRGLKGRGAFDAHVADDGQVMVEGEAVGQVMGFRFRPANSSRQTLDRALTSAARQAVAPEVARRVRVLCKDNCDALHIDAALTVLWRGEPIARLRCGRDALAPNVEVLASDALDADMTQRIRKRLEAWLSSWIRDGVGALVKLRDAPLHGAARGIAYQLIEGLGVAMGKGCLKLTRELDEEGRKSLARLGVRLGFYGAYLKPLMSSRDLELRAILWSLANRAETLPVVPARGEVAIDAGDGLANGFYQAIGYRRLGPRALRVDMAERLAADIRKLTRKGSSEAPAELISLSGSSRTQFVAIVTALGFRAVLEGDKVTLVPPRHKGRKKPVAKKIDPASPFARLAELEIAR